MRKNLFLTLSVITLTTLTACTIDDNGELRFTWLFWFILIAFILLVIITAISTADDGKKAKAKFAEKGISPSDFIQTGDISAGHPSLQNGLENSLILKENDLLKIYSVKDYSLFEFGHDFPKYSYASIPVSAVKDISILDKTEIERKITAGRLFLVGIFALAWKKKKVHEQAYLVIKWTYKEKFENETLFVFEGKDSISKANNARYKLINMVS